MKKNNIILVAIIILSALMILIVSKKTENPDHQPSVRQVQVIKNAILEELQVAEGRFLEIEYSETVSTALVKIGGIREEIDNVDDKEDKLIELYEEAKTLTIIAIEEKHNQQKESLDRQKREGLLEK
jgi:hypothetical protein